MAHDEKVRSHWGLRQLTHEQRVKLSRENLAKFSDDDMIL